MSQDKMLKTRRCCIEYLFLSELNVMLIKIVENEDTLVIVIDEQIYGKKRVKDRRK